MQDPEDARPALPPAATALVARLGLTPHPEGGFFRELFRSPLAVRPADGRPPRAALTTIDFVLAAGQHSAWHRVASDEVWHLLEGGPLRLWLLPPEPAGAAAAPVVLQAGGSRRHVVPAHWWQAAEPLAEYAYVGATVGPGFDYADFAFGRNDPALRAAVAADRALARWL